MGSVRTSILEDLYLYTMTSPRPTSTPSTATSHQSIDSRQAKPPPCHECRALAGGKNTVALELPTA